MDKFTLLYKLNDGISLKVHQSWYKLFEKQTKEDVILTLKKHLYEPGEYVLFLTVKNGAIRHKNDQNFFSGWLTKSDINAIGGMTSIGPVQFDYHDDTFEKCDFINVFPTIDCEKRVPNFNPLLMLVGEDLFPSAKEREIVAKRTADQFMKEIIKSVSFPLEINCDYPDVIFEIIFVNNPSQIAIDNLVITIENAIMTYNKNHNDGIHHFDFTEKSTDAISLHIDFGDCDIPALSYLLKELSNIDLDIKEVHLK